MTVSRSRAVEGSGGREGRRTDVAGSPRANRQGPRQRPTAVPAGAGQPDPGSRSRSRGPHVGGWSDRGSGVVATLGNRPEEASVSSAGETPEFQGVTVGRSFDPTTSDRSCSGCAHRIGLIDDADLTRSSATLRRIQPRSWGRASTSAGRAVEGARPDSRWPSPARLAARGRARPTQPDRRGDRSPAEGDPAGIGRGRPGRRRRQLPDRRDLPRTDRGGGKGRLEPAPCQHGPGLTAADGARPDLPRPGPSRSGDRPGGPLRRRHEERQGGRRQGRCPWPGEPVDRQILIASG